MCLSRASQAVYETSQFTAQNRRKQVPFDAEVMPHHCRRELEKSRLSEMHRCWQTVRYTAHTLYVHVWVMLIITLKRDAIH